MNRPALPIPFALALLVTALPAISVGQTSTPESSPSAPPTGGSVSMQFPHASVLDILSFYERLTGKRIIRDSNLQGPEISIMVAEQIPAPEAVSLIESSLLLNGYTIVPVDARTVKVLGPSRPPEDRGIASLSRGIATACGGRQNRQLLQAAEIPLPQEAISILQGVVQLNAYGSLVAIPNTSALVITDKTPVIRKALALLEVVDHEPTQIITEFIPLQRASAEKVVETLGQMFGSGGSGGAGAAQPQGQQGAVVSAGGEAHLLSGKAQFIADKRTNRLLIVVKAENYKYLRELIAKLDQPLESDQPLVRPLNYLPVSDIFPVLVDMLKGKDDATNSTASSQTQQQTQQQVQNQGGSMGTQSPVVRRHREFP